MDLTRFAIDKTRITAVAFLVICASGYRSYVGMSRAEDPGFIIRTAVVRTMFPGASPERVEQLVTDKLEKAIQEMPEIDFLRSESKTGISIVFVNILESYTEMRPIWDSLRRKVDRVAPDLPDGIIGPIVDDEFGDVFGTIVTITGSDFDYRYLKEVADEVRDELLLIDEVAKVEISGAQQERIFVEYNNARLSELGLSPSQLSQILSARNITLPGGNIILEQEQIVLEPSGNFESLEDLRNTVLNLPGGSDLIFLRDIAEIERGYIDPPQSLMRTRGTRSLGLAISMRAGGNILTLGEQVRSSIERIQERYPIGVEFDFLQFQAGDVQRLIDGFVGNLVQAVVIVTLVMLVFLGVRTGLVVASLIPTAILMAFMVMGFLSIGLDQMSIAALIIALGMLVDNAIVMSESIMVAMQEGKAKVEAAVDSARELRIPLLTSSLTTAAAFLPIYLAESATGEYTAPLFQVVTITLLSSWIIALTLIPLLCVLFIRVKPHMQRKGNGDASQPRGEAGLYDTRFYRAYRGSLLMALRHRWLFLAAVAAVFFLSLNLFGLIPNIFFPPNSRPTLTADLTLPTGTPLERTAEMAEEFDRFIAENLAVDNRVGGDVDAGATESDGPSAGQGITIWSTFIGEGAPRFLLPINPEQPSPEYALILANATSREHVEVLVGELEAFAAGFPNLKAVVRPLPLGPPAWPPVEVRLSGRDPKRLFVLVDEVKSRLRSLPGTKNIDDDWGARTKKLFVDIDQPRALRAGVSSQDIAISLQTFLSGIETTEFREQDEIIPITLRSVASQRQDIDRVETLNVYSQLTGQSVPLKQVADVRVEFQPARIFRRDRVRTVTVESALNAGFTAAEIHAQMRPWLDEKLLEYGPGFAYEIGGETEASQDSQASIAAKLPIAGMIIVLLLVGQFNSIRRPLIILITIPLGLIGVIVGLLAANLYFGFMTFLGIISLAGIVINNAIVLIDRIDLEININALEPARAVIESAQRRLRPILMTTCTTIGGLIPLYLGGGPMWEPMAMAIMGGLLFATVLTLGVVPTLYSIFFGVGFRDFVYEPEVTGPSTPSGQGEDA